MQQLNPLIWNNDELLPEVAKRLEVIKTKFIDGLDENEIPAVVVDTRIVGSNASYNYTEFSDIDLHIVVDLSSYDENKKQLLKTIYNYYKAAFNSKYTITIKGINVELYIEDADTPANSKGVYSLDEGKWLKKPINISNGNVDISRSLKYMIDKFEEVKILNDSDLAKSLLDLLYANRIKSLATEGEYGVDNLVFKEFRNRGYLQELKDIIVNSESKELSLEDLRETLIEAYYNVDGKEFWDYRTDDVEFIDEEHLRPNIFDTKTLGGFSAYDKYMEDSAYIQNITPNEFYEHAAKGFGRTVDYLKQRSIADADVLEHIKDVLFIAKKKLPMPFISKSDGSKEEGLHRMYVAGEMFGWNKPFPVLVLP